MLPNPLHPAIVHFPIVLAVILPLFALGAWWAISRGARPTRAWALPTAVALTLALSAFAALRTGEAEEERVESVVSEETLHAHEEAGERFFVLSGVLLLVMGAGLIPGGIGAGARVVAAAGSMLLVAAALQVGAAGGELVYRDGAASVYVDATAADADDRSRIDDVEQQFPIVASLQAEHHEVHTQLEAATKLTDAVGDAARELALVLGPHFLREEQIALPPLALLQPLARDEYGSEMHAVLPLTDSLKRELPRMLEEHVAIAAAARRLEDVARTRGNVRVLELAQKIQQHARTEEEVHYPAAIVVGEVVRLRAGRH